MRVLILLLCCAYASFIYAANVNTAGFVQGLWYDREEIFANEPVRLYVAIRNNTGSDLTGKVEFEDNDKIIGSANVSALDKRIIESWIDWTPTYGEHKIIATLSRVELSAVGTTTRQIEVVESTANETIFVDYDTDKDKSSNNNDPDDDGDGIKDEDDSEPLKFNKAKSNNDSDNVAGVEDSGEDGNESHGEDDIEEANADGYVPGLEKYLNDNRADFVLSGVTNFITKAKTNLDEYREERNNKTAETKIKQPVTETTPVTENKSSTEENTASDEAPYSSFGEVTRTQNGGSGWPSKIFDLVKNFMSSIYTFILFIISTYLGHPVIVQLTLLFLIIFIIFKLAKRLASRPY